MCLDLEAHGAALLAVDHVCHLRSSRVLQRHPLVQDQHGSWYQRGRLSPGSASVSCGTLDQALTLGLTCLRVSGGKDSTILPGLLPSLPAEVRVCR